MSDPHFCTCTDLECSLNLNSPGCRHGNCDRCVKKNLKAGEIPSCFFKAVHEDVGHVPSSGVRRSLLLLGWCLLRDGGLQQWADGVFV